MFACEKTVQIVESVSGPISDEIMSYVNGTLSEITPRENVRPVSTEIGEVCHNTLLEILDKFVRYRINLEIVGKFLTDYGYGKAVCAMFVASLSRQKTRRSGETLLKSDGTEKSSRERKVRSQKDLRRELDVLNANALCILFGGMDKTRLVFPVEFDGQALFTGKRETTENPFGINLTHKTVRNPEDMSKFLRVERTESVSSSWHRFSAVDIHGNKMDFVGVFDGIDRYNIREIIAQNVENWNKPAEIRSVIMTTKEREKINRKLSVEHGLDSMPVAKRLKRTMQGGIKNTIVASYAASVFRYHTIEHGNEMNEYLLDGMNEDKISRRSHEMDNSESLIEKLKKGITTKIEEIILDGILDDNSTNALRAYQTHCVQAGENAIPQRSFYRIWHRTMDKLRAIAGNDE